ncbi:MAG: tetraacyldisaccharide 4'-kinase [Rickettsiales bacterium]|jgi:tetraacyldisaccharide 4'-kinase|nr:tetraacyldisaccharide 4'-kinase [Rickettsiales bacterium]
MNTPSWFLKRNFAARALSPLAFLYNAAAKAHFIVRSFGAAASKKPVICVGNIFAGGVGKTPIVMEIAQNTPNSAILMRGYGGGKTGKAVKTDTVRDIGDEAKMLSKHADVFVGKNRRANLSKMQKYDCIIMDDGFQNPTIKKTVSILVFDGNLGIGNGYILPAGPLRESLKSGLARADAVIIVGEDKTGLKNMIKNIPVFSAARKFQSIKFGKRIAAFSGIGYPEKFFRSLRELSGRETAVELSFPDHHEFTESELSKLAAIRAELWTTEKDAARLPDWFVKKVKVLKMTTEIEKEFYKWLRSKIRSK